MIAAMNCPTCGAPLDLGATSCPKCGALRGVASTSPIDRLADTAAEAVHDVGRAIQSVQRVGDEVAATGREALRTVRSSGSRGKGAWSAAKNLTSPDSSKRTPRVDTDRRSRGRTTPSTGISRARARASARADRARASRRPIRPTEHRAREDET